MLNVHLDRIPAWVISFDDDPLHRLAEPLRALGFDLRRLGAVRGSHLSARDMQDVDLQAIHLRTGRWPTAGMVGCALSHREVYRELLASGSQWGLVLEDDVVLRSNWYFPLTLLAHAQWGAKGKPMIIQLYTRGARFFRRDSVVKLKEGGVAFEFVFPPGQTAAYLINSQAASALLERPVDGPADWPSASAGITFLGVHPWVFGESGRPSTIEEPSPVPWRWRVEQVLGINAMKAWREGASLRETWKINLGPYLASVVARKWGSSCPYGADGPLVPFALRRTARR